MISTARVKEQEKEEMVTGTEAKKERPQAQAADPSPKELEEVYQLHTLANLVYSRLAADASPWMNPWMLPTFPTAGAPPMQAAPPPVPWAQGVPSSPILPVVWGW